MMEKESTRFRRELRELELFDDYCYTNGKANRLLQLIAEAEAKERANVKK